MCQLLLLKLALGSERIQNERDGGKEAWLIYFLSLIGQEATPEIKEKMEWPCQIHKMLNDNRTWSKRRTKQHTFSYTVVARCNVIKKSTFRWGVGGKVLIQLLCVEMKKSKSI